MSKEDLTNYIYSFFDSIINFIKLFSLPIILGVLTKVGIDLKDRRITIRESVFYMIVGTVTSYYIAPILDEYVTSPSILAAAGFIVGTMSIQIAKWITRDSVVSSWLDLINDSLKSLWHKWIEKFKPKK